MNAVTRIALVAILFVGPAVSAAEVDPLLPKQAEQIIFVNVRQLIDSDMVKKYGLPKVKEAMKKGETEEIIEKLGIDPYKDITNATFAIWDRDRPAQKVEGNPEEKPIEENQPPRRRGGPSTFAILRGKFDVERLYKAADELSSRFVDKVSVETENEQKLIKMGDMENPFYIIIADAAMVLAGTDKKMVLESLAARRSKVKPKAKLNPKLTALLLRQDAKASFFFCQLTEGKMDRIPNLSTLPGIDGDQLKEQLGKLHSMCFTLRVGKEVEAELTAGMKDADTADSFGVNVDKLLGLAKTFFPLAVVQQPKMETFVADFTKTVKYEVKRSDVIVSLRLSVDAIRQLAGGEEE